MVRANEKIAKWLVSVIGSLSFALCSSSATYGAEPTTGAGKVEEPAKGAEAGKTPAPAATKESAAKGDSKKADKAGAKDAKASKNPVVVMETSMGKIVIELFPEVKETTENFIKYVKDGFYNGTVFHRIVKSDNMEVIQGGGFKMDKDVHVEKKTRGTIKNEASLPNAEGTIAMARMKEPDSATAQFYINIKAHTFLDKNPGSAGYAVFGKVIEGLDVATKINLVHTVTGKARGADGQVGAMPEVPEKPVVIKKAVMRK